MRKICFGLLGLLFFTACQIREEITFNDDGSGSYAVGFDLSEMMGMAPATENDTVVPQTIDTVVVFADFLEEKKDSIATLSKKEQQRLENLRPLRFSMKMDDSEKKMDMHLSYAFETLDDIDKFAEAIATADIKELNQTMDPLAGMMGGKGAKKDSTEKGGLEDIFKMAESFDTRFSKKGFSRKITQDAIAEMAKKKDTSLKADDPFVDMMRFKQVYHFPYKVKSVSNPNARILSDFKGVELEANMYQMNNDPDYFDIEVAFEK
ncbi:hypothetical protein [Maribacter sp. 2-571]|uniref:hypothetical protein n=1 Tax=Maribacter sp. 2-571 TaxID=3417569 RepID=UPI003D33646D